MQRTRTLIFVPAIVSTILIISLLIMPPQQTQAYTSLKPGSWALHANGFVGTLEIVSVSPGGRIGVTTEYGGSEPVPAPGTYEPTTKVIKFTRQVSEGERQDYVGYLFADGNPGSSEADRMSGYVRAVDPRGGYHGTFGWYAFLIS
jgi:hypothetical protein